MKKMVFGIAFALCALVSFSATAQNYPFWVERPTNSGSVWCNIAQTNFTFTCSQKTSVFATTPSTYTSAPTGSYYSNPYYTFAYGGYWVTPTNTLKLDVTVPSGYTATISNNNAVARQVYLRIGFSQDGGYNFAVWFPSATVTVPAYGTKTVEIPACSHQFESIPINSTNAGESYPTLVYFQLIDVN
jgi:hypothetical protein